MKLEALKKLGLRFAKGFGRFAPFNLVAIAVAVILVLDNHSVLTETTASNLVRGLYWGALMGVLCQLEGERYGKTWLKIAAWPVTVLFGALGWWFWFSIVEKSLGFGVWGMVYSGTVIALVAASIVTLYRLADEKTLISRLVANTIVVLGAVVIFVVSIELCIYAFDALVHDVPNILYEDAFMVLYLVLTQVGFSSLLPGKDTSDDSSNRGAAFLFWLLLPASLILLAILYLYLGRILVTRTMPSGELNWFGSVSLATYVFFWLALRDSTRPFFRRFVRWGWALLIPVLVAQIVGIVIRYNAYGLSAPRYAGMVTLMVGIFALVLAMFDRRPRVLFSFIAVVGIVFTVTPLNIKDVPIRNQEARLEAALVRCGIDPAGDLKAPGPIPEAEAKIICGAWNYLEGAQPVYCRPKLVQALREKPGKDSLWARLNIDASKMPKGRCGGCSDSRLSGVTFSICGERKFPIEGYRQARMVKHISVTERVGRYYMALPREITGRPEQIDVTEHIERLKAAAKWDGLVPTVRTTCSVPLLALVWELRPGLAFTVVAPDFRCRGTVGKPPESFSFFECLILTK